VERKYAYLRFLDETRDVDGDVLEVGCWLGGTAALGSSFLRRTGSPRRYVCVDTFEGFVPEQFAHDADRGTPAKHAALFDDGGETLVRRLLDRWGEPQVELVRGDICTIDARLLPESIAVCLLDVDLEIPIYEGLKRIVPRLAPGAVVVVDDCPESTSWVGARIGYRRFCDEAGRPEEYCFGFGVVRA
jgi:O-methyltransferase